nr:putative mitochondrial protein [Tanacetum cinerariifolium]
MCVGPEYGLEKTSVCPWSKISRDIEEWTEDRYETPRDQRDDVKGWIYRCRQFFKIDGIDDNDRMEFVFMNVFDKALIWHQQFCRRFGENCPWELSEKEVLKRFGTVLEDPLMELKKLKQEGTIKDY